jgi:peptidoglycan/xylan/chitin deacetylase (PgdA/CDA1 family)
MSALLRRSAVLVYHGVGSPDGDDMRLLITLERLESQIRFLQRRGYRFVTAEELIDREPERGAVALTFDDGFRSWLTEVAPLLERLGVRGTFYVCPGLFGGQHWDVGGEPGRLLTQDEAGALAERGMELGSHTLTHPDLREVDDAALLAELEQSKAAVERVTGRPCRTLAYPYGLCDEQVEQAAAEAGYELAFAWLPGPWRRFAAPRLPAPPRHGGVGLALKLLGIRSRRR